MKARSRAERLTSAGAQPLGCRSVETKLALGLAGVLEGVCRWLPGQPEPLLTRYMVGVLAKSTTLDISAARRDLGYLPRVSVDEGFERFVRWWKGQKR